MRAVNWRLHLAVGAWAQSRREVENLKKSADSTAAFSRALAISQKELEETRRILMGERERGSRLAAQVNELQGCREQLDKANQELSQVRREHDDEVRARQQFFEKRWDQLRASHAEEKDNWSKRLEEEEHRRRQQQDQLDRLNKELAEAADRLKWADGRAALLSNELDDAHQELGERQSRIDELEENLRQSQSAKAKALNRTQALSGELARRDEQVQCSLFRLSRPFGHSFIRLLGFRLQMNKITLEFQERLTAFGEEMASRHRKVSELEQQLTEAVARASSAVEEYKGSTQFAEERRAACADAFRFGEEEARARISQTYPNLDLSCLEPEYYETRTPGPEEDEYGEISDVDLEAILGAEAAAEVPRRDTTEKGESSSAPTDVVAGGVRSDSKT